MQWTFARSRQFKWAAIVGLLLIRPPVADAQLTSAELQRSAHDWIAKHSDLSRRGYAAYRHVLADVELYHHLRRQVRLDSAVFSVKGDHIEVNPRPLRVLPPHQQAELISDVRKLLDKILQVDMAAEDAQRWVDTSTIAFGAPVNDRRLDEITDVDFIAAVGGFAKALDQDNQWDARGFGQLRQVKLNDDPFQRYGGTLAGQLNWSLSLANPGHVLPPITRPVRNAASRLQRRMSERDTQIVEGFLNGVQNRHANHWRELLPKLQQFVVEAFSTYELPATGQPLMDRVTAERIEMRLSDQMMPQRNRAAGNNSDLNPPLVVMIESRLPREYDNLRPRMGAAAPGVSRSVPDRVFTTQNGVQFSTGSPTQTEVPTHALRQLDRGDAVNARGPRKLTPLIDFDGFAPGAVSSLAFSPGSRWLAAAGDVVRILDLETE